MGDGSDYDLIGVSLLLTEDQAFAGTRRLDDAPDGVYVFDRSEAGWTQSQILRAENGTEGDWFGAAMVATGNELLIGAPFSDELEVDSGAVYVFRWESGEWRQSQVLVPWEETGQGTPAHQRWFGDALATDGELLLVGAPGDTAVYVLRREQDQWVPARKIWDRFGDGGAFGTSVALRGRTAFVGSSNEGRSYSGAVFAFELKQELGEPCSTNAECITGLCADGTCVEPTGAGGEGGAAGGSGAPGANGGAGDGTGGSGGTGSSPGCGCRTSGAGRDAGVAAVVLAFLLTASRRIRGLRRPRGFAQRTPD
jgi:hypothetical protein